MTKKLEVTKSIEQLIKEGVIKKTYLKYIITGCPRSATLYMALLFQSAGIPIPHEQYFGPPGAGFWLNYAIGDSSSLAVPYLNRLPKDTKIIHIVRNPIKVVTELKAWALFDGDNIDKFWFGWLIKDFFPSVMEYEERDRYLAFYIGWNRYIEDFTKLRYRIEDINKNPKKIFDDLGEDVKGKKLYRNTRTHASNEKIKYLTKKDLDGCELRQDFIDYANYLGYKL